MAEEKKRAPRSSSAKKPVRRRNLGVAEVTEIVGEFSPTKLIEFTEGLIKKYSWSAGIMRSRFVAGAVASHEDAIAERGEDPGVVKTEKAPPPVRTSASQRRREEIAAMAQAEGR